MTDNIRCSIRYFAAVKNDLRLSIVTSASSTMASAEEADPTRLSCLLSGKALLIDLKMYFFYSYYYC